MKTLKILSIISTLLLFFVQGFAQNQATISGLDSIYCISNTSIQPPVQMTGTPAGGQFSGDGVFGTTFSPFMAGVGVHTIKYTVTGANGTTMTATKVVKVKQAPEAHITGLPGGQPGGMVTICKSAPPITLTGHPGGGQFSGPGITPGSSPNSAIFTPSSVNGQQGPVTITYAGVSEQGCPFSTTVQVMLVETPPMPINIPDVLCESSPAIQLPSMQGSLQWSGDGVIPTNMGYVFKPSEAGPGYHLIMYTGTFMGCQVSGMDTVLVQDAVEASIGGIANGDIICKSSSPIELVLTPAGGMLIGPGVQPNSNVFNPQNAPIGPVTLTYMNTNDPNGGCPYNVSVTFKVSEGPEAKIQSLKEQYCIGAEPDEVIGLPAGGTFYVDGQMMEGNMFSPSAWGAGQHVVSYSGNFNGCEYSVSRMTVVKVDVPATMQGLDGTVCLSADPMTMNAQPGGGTYSVDSMPIDGNKFNPSDWGAGTHFVTYSGMTDGGCYFTTSKTVTVTQPPVLSATTVNPTCSVCPNGKISVMASGGTAPYKYKLGDGVWQSEGVFNLLVGGTYIIRVKDASGCVAQISVTLTAPPACPAPGNISVTNTAPGAYVASWTAVTSALSYTIQYREVGTDTWTTISNIIGTSREISGLNPTAFYELQVRTRCLTTGNGSFSASANFGGEVQNNCAVPTGLTVSNITDVSVLAKWTAVSGATSYQVQYRRASGGNWSTVTAAGTSSTLSGLTAGMSYVVRVRSVCGNNSSLWGATVSFTTSNGTRLGAFDSSVNADFTLYPNPNRGATNLSFSSEFSGVANVSLIDLTGRTIDTRSIDVNAGINDVALNFEHISAGAYMLKFTNASDVRIVKMIIE